MIHTRVIIQDAHSLHVVLTHRILLTSPHHPQSSIYTVARTTSHQHSRALLKSMPKKHQPAFLSIKPQPTPASSRATNEAPATPLSVNERISQLRREQTPRATSQRINEVTEVVSHRTVPPHLRRLLHMTEVDAPPPKPGTRRRLRPGERPPPGPAAPSSWLAASRHAPKGLRARFGQDAAVGRFCRLARVHDDEYKVRHPIRNGLDAA